MTTTPLADLTQAELTKVWIGIQRDPAFDHLRGSAEVPVNFVPGDGQCVTPPVAFVGEAPGRTEDERQLPFVGQAGQLLEELMGEIGLERSAVWITNVIKYRPPNNRQPTWPERESSRKWLQAELMLVRPSVIVPLGSTTLSLVRPQPITRIHGQAFGRGRWIYLPMFHPAYLLRRRDLLPVAREDFQQLARLLNQDRRTL